MVSNVRSIGVSFSVLLAFARGAAAWGNLGHETVGFVAMEVCIYINPCLY